MNIGELSNTNKDPQKLTITLHTFQMNSFRKDSVSDQKADDNKVEEKVDALCYYINCFGETLNSVIEEIKWEAIYGSRPENHSVYMEIVGEAEQIAFLSSVVRQLMSYEASVSYQFRIIRVIKDFSYYHGVSKLISVLLSYLHITNTKQYEFLKYLLRIDIEIVDSLFGEPREERFVEDSDDSHDEEIEEFSSDEDE